MDDLLQQEFDAVARHLLTQKTRAVVLTDLGASCAYRGTEGRKCAVGCRISDKFYSLGIEGKSILEIEVGYAVARSIGLDSLPDELIDLYVALQRLHDNTPPVMWPEELRFLARGLELSTEVLDEFA